MLKGEKINRIISGVNRDIKNRKSAAKLQRGAGSTTIPREGSRYKRIEVISP